MTIKGLLLMTLPMLSAALLSAILLLPFCTTTKSIAEAPYQNPISEPTSTPTNTSVTPPVQIVQATPTTILVKPPEWNHFIPTITFIGMINDDSVKSLEDSFEMLNGAHVEGIVLQIDSPGGSLDAGFKMMRAIEESKAPVYCVADHMAASMAFYALQSCKVRAMTRRTYLLAHKPHYGEAVDNGTIASMKEAIEDLNRMSRELEEQAARRMKLTVAQIDEKISEKDWWIDADEAIVVGAVDQLVSTGADFSKHLRDTGTP